MPLVASEPSSEARKSLQADLLRKQKRLVNSSLSLWRIPQDATANIHNISENTTFLIEAAGGFKAILRLHRAGYHSRRAVECELNWIRALGEDASLLVPKVIPARNGLPIQIASIPGRLDEQMLVMFEFVEGKQLEESDDLTQIFENLGEIAAKSHNHSISWSRPAPFERPEWNLDAFFGSKPIWGSWRAGPGVDTSISALLERVASKIVQRLQDFGKSRQRYGLIHADMRLANLLVDGDRICLIDFDDCGFGWFLYDFAASVSFFEDSRKISCLKQAWISGYRKIRDLSDDEVKEIDSFVMLRRMALLGWLGSHAEVPEAQALASDFAATTALLGERYLTHIP